MEIKNIDTQYDQAIEQTINQISKLLDDPEPQINSEPQIISVEQINPEPQIIPNEPIEYELINHVRNLQRLQFDTNRRIKYLINKILKHKISTNHKCFQNLVNSIYQIIFKTKNNITMIVNSLVEMNNIFNKLNVKYLIFSQNINHSHGFVADNLYVLIQNHFNNIDCSNLKILDVGGGDGNILHLIGNKLNNSNNCLYCLESDDLTWNETYTNHYQNVNYLKWNNQNFDNFVIDNIDVCICMVSLHHMTNQTLVNLMTNLKRCIKPNGLVIIKEHDVNNPNIARIVDWEHYIYHVCNTANKDMTHTNTAKFVKSFINNYKSKAMYDKMFDEFDFCELYETNRQFQPMQNQTYQINNPTNLYWKMYQKK